MLLKTESYLMNPRYKLFKKWLIPTSVQEVRQFLGTTSYYRRFIKNYAHLASPLTDLTQGTGPKRRSIEWTDLCQEAFVTLKKELMNTPLLSPPVANKPYKVYTDASDFACGAVLCQDDDQGVAYPVAFESKKFYKAEKKTTLPKKGNCSLSCMLYVLGGVFWNETKPYKFGSGHDQNQRPMIKKGRRQGDITLLP